MNTTKARYPKRFPFFAFYFNRLMMKACAGALIGPDAAWLVACIANTEDAKRYTGPVLFFGHNLADQIGVSEPAMRRMRDRAVRHHWLHYESGGNRKPGVYWVLIPDDEAAKFDDIVNNRDSTGDPVEDEYVGPPQIRTNTTISVPASDGEKRRRSGAEVEVEPALNRRRGGGRTGAEVEVEPALNRRPSSSESEEERETDRQTVCARGDGTADERTEPQEPRSGAGEGDFPSTPLIVDPGATGAIPDRPDEFPAVDTYRPGFQSAEDQQLRRVFLNVWNESNMLPVQRAAFNASLLEALKARMRDSFWRDNWRAAVERASDIPFLAGGKDRKKGPLDVGEFLFNEDLVRQIVSGKFDPRPAVPAAAPATTPAKPAAEDPRAKAIREYREKQQAAREGTGNGG